MRDSSVAGVSGYVAAAAARAGLPHARRPIFLLVTEDGPRLEALAMDLKRRYAADYRVVTAASADAALTMLAELADSGAVVALLIADERLKEMPAVDFLARAHDLHPGARRVLLVERGDWSATHPAVCAMALGRIDYHLYVPWYPLERGLYPAVSEFLAAWDKSREPSAAVVRIVGGAHSARAHHLRDLLTRGGVPYLSSPTTPTWAGNCCVSTDWKAPPGRWLSTTTARCSSTRRGPTCWRRLASRRTWG